MGNTAAISDLPNGVDILGPVQPGFEEILNLKALNFVAGLARTYTRRVPELLDARRQRQALFDAGERPNFLESTKSVRERDWTVAPLPKDLLDRRVDYRAS